MRGDGFLLKFGVVVGFYAECGTDPPHISLSSIVAWWGRVARLSPFFFVEEGQGMKDKDFQRCT
jgi:hypothetical protein